MRPPSTTTEKYCFYEVRGKFVALPEGPLAALREGMICLFVFCVFVSFSIFVVLVFLSCWSVHLCLPHICLSLTEVHLVRLQHCTWGALRLCIFNMLIPCKTLHTGCTSRLPWRSTRGAPDKIALGYEGFPICNTLVTHLDEFVSRKNPPHAWCVSRQAQKLMQTRKKKKFPAIF